jgi:hypothetical protein
MAETHVQNDARNNITSTITFYVAVNGEIWYDVK